MNFRQIKTNLKPGHPFELQLSENVSLDPFESQLVPPLLGAGLSQFRILVRLPPLQVAEQEPQFPQGPQAPSIADTSGEKIIPQ